MELDDRRYPGFREFVLARGTALSRTAYLLVGDHQLAEDLVQSALARVLRHWRRIARDNPEAYVRRTMYHLHLSWWRRTRPAAVPSDPLPERIGPDEIDRAALRVSLDAALARLSKRQRLVLVMRFYEDLTEQQVADALGCSVGTVKRHAHDGLARLRAEAAHLVADELTRLGR